MIYIHILSHENAYAQRRRTFLLVNSWKTLRKTYVSLEESLEDVFPIKRNKSLRFLFIVSHLPRNPYIHASFGLFSWVEIIPLFSL